MSETKYEGQINPGMYFCIVEGGVSTVERILSIDDHFVRSSYKRSEDKSWPCTYPVLEFRRLARPVAPPDGDWKPYVSKEQDRAWSGLLHKDLRVGDVVSVDSKYSHFVARITGTSGGAVPFELLAGDCEGESHIMGWIAYCRVLIPAEKAEPVKTEYAVARYISPENRKRLSDAAKTNRLQEVAEVEKVTEMVPGGVYGLRVNYGTSFSSVASGAVEYLGSDRVRWFELEGSPGGSERQLSSPAKNYEAWRVIRMKPEVVTKAEEPKKYVDNQVLLEASAGTKDYRVTGSLRHCPSVSAPPFTYMVKVISLDGKTCEKVCDGADSDEAEARETMMDRFTAAVGKVMDEDR